MPRVSLADVARATGLSTCTVSKALRGDPVVAAGTRDRVAAAAGSLGYRPDPLLSEFGRRRWRRSVRQKKVSVAWLRRGPARGSTDRTPLAAARREAEAMGFGFEVLDEESPGPASLRILRERGVRALLLGTVSVAPDLEAGSFALVACGARTDAHPCHRVRPAWFRAVRELVGRLASERGYARVGVCFDRETEGAPENEVIAAAIEGLRSHPESEALVCPPWWGRLEDRRAWERWYRRVRPDVLVMRSVDYVYRLRDWGFDVPGDVGAATVFTSFDPAETGSAGMAGLVPRLDLAGTMAVRVADALLREGRLGWQADPVETLVPVAFRDGNTLRPRR